MATRKTLSTLTLLLVIILGASKLNAQYVGTSYIGASAGAIAQHSNSKFASTEAGLSLSYGYLVSDKLTLDVPVMYHRLRSDVLRGHHFSLLPTAYYILSRRDKSRLELGGTLGLGYDTYAKPESDLVEIKGELNTLGVVLGASLRYTHSLSSKLALQATYRFLYRPKSFEDMAQVLTAGIVFYL